MRILALLTLLGLSLGVSSAGFSSPALAEEAASPATAVLDRHLKAFAEHDLDAIMADYADDSVFITPQGVLTGKSEIRALFEGLLKEFSSREARVTVQTRHASGPVAYIVWSAETPENSYTLATDTLYVVDDLIRYQTFAAQVSAK